MEVVKQYSWQHSLEFVRNLKNYMDQTLTHIFRNFQTVCIEII